MKKIFYSLLFAAATVGLTSCNEEYTVYEGPDFVMFSDSEYVVAVQDDQTIFEIPISAARTASYDRTLAVEVLEKQSNAIEGRHYKLESNTITIKAGELVGKVKVRGLYSNIGINDSIGFCLRLLADKKLQSDLYGTDATVELRKVAPFNIEKFTGYCVVQSTYINNYVQTTDQVLARAIVDPEKENSVIIKDFIYKGYDMKVTFETADPLNPLISFDDQVFAPTSEAFGTLYGDGFIYATQPTNYISYYSTNEDFMFQYMTLYVPNVGSVGSFVNIVKWISDDEAEKLMREGY